MIHYLLIRDDGSIMQRGACHAEEDIPVLKGVRAEVISENDVRKPKEAPPPDYSRFRLMDYPTIGDQLDVLWKVISAGQMADSIPEAKAMLEKITAVKQKHPKSK